LLQCREQWADCTGSVLSVACIKSLFGALTRCAELLQQAVSQEIELPAWMNLKTMRDSVTGVVAGVVQVFQTFINFLWNLFMQLLDLWVFVVVLWVFVSSEVSVFTWLLQNFTILEETIVEKVAFESTKKIHGVFVSLLKIFLFHGTFTGLSLYAFELSYPCCIALLSAFAAVVDERLMLVILAPSTLQLVFDPQVSPWCIATFHRFDWWHSSWDTTSATALFLGLQFMRCVWPGISAHIYSDHVEDPVLCYVVGFSVFGGLSLYGVTGLIIGPIVATIPFTIKDLFAVYRDWATNPSPLLSPQATGSPTATGSPSSLLGGGSSNGSTPKVSFPCYRSETSTTHSQVCYV